MGHIRLFGGPERGEIQPARCPCTYDVIVQCFLVREGQRPVEKENRSGLRAFFPGCSLCPGFLGSLNLIPQQ